MGERFRAYLDDELTAAERAALDAELAASPALAAEFAEYRRTVELLRGLPAPEPPERFVERVEGRIRRRSHGRYFALEPRLRLPYEAVTTIILLAAMLSLFVYAAPSAENPVLLGPARASLGLPDGGCDDPVIAADYQRAATALAGWGEVTRPGNCQLAVVVPADRLPAFLEALATDGRAWEAAERVDDPATDAVRFLLRRRP